MAIRAADTSGMHKEERKRYERLKKIYALDSENKKQPKTLQELNQELINRAQRARERAQMDKVSALPNRAEDE